MQIQKVQNIIYEIRGQQVMLDFTLAVLYEVETKAVNQAVKAIAIARGYLLEEGVDVICVPHFVEVDIDDQERTAVRILVEPRKN